MKINKSHILIILVIFILFLPLWINPFTVGGDLDYYFSKTLSNLISVPFTWREFFGAGGFGEYTISTLWSWPLVFMVSFLSALGLEYSLIIKIFFLIPVILLSFFSIKKLTDFYEISSWPQAIAIVFYSLNTYILLLIDGGQLGLSLAYGLFPLVFLSIQKYLKKPSFKNVISTVIFTLLLSIFDIRIILMLFFLVILSGLFEVFLRRQFNIIFSYLKLGLITGFFLIGIHAYWLLPAIVFRLPELPLNYGRESQVGFLSFANITHALYLIQPHWYENIFGRIGQIKPEFALIPILVFSGAILRKKDLRFAFWLLVSLISIFLIKGSNEPFPNVYGWLFKNIPGFSVFRDPTKFFFLLVLSYTVLLGISTGEIIKRLSKFPKMKLTFGLFCLVYIIFLARPIWSGNMTGLFSEPIYKEEYLKLSKILSGESSFSRVIWIPKKPSFGFFSSIHPSVDGLSLIQTRPFAVGTKGSYESLNFFREAPYVGELLNISAVGYIAYPYLDPRRDDMHPDNIRYFSTFLNQLSNIDGVSKVENSPIPLLKVSKHQDKIFAVSNLWWVIGSDDLYNEVTKSSKLSLTKNALVFAEERKGLGETLDRLPEAKVVLNNKTFLDLSASFISGEKILFPADKLDFAPGETGWWKREAPDLIGWREFLQTKYGIDNQDFDLSGGWAVGEGSLDLKVQNLKFKKGEVLLARAMESSRSGNLKFYQQNNLIGEITTKNDASANVRWFEIGRLADDGKLTISSSGDINVVNAVASVDPRQWQDFKNKVVELNNKGRIKQFSSLNVEDLETKITFETINSSKYKVKVSGLTQPQTLVFSENYDPLWKIEGKSPIPVYSFLNGFRIEKDGEYIIEFEPQKYVLSGFFISGFTVFILVINLLFLKNKLKRLSHEV